MKIATKMSVKTGIDNLSTTTPPIEIWAKKCFQTIKNLCVT